MKTMKIPHTIVPIIGKIIYLWVNAFKKFLEDVFFVIIPIISNIAKNKSINRVITWLKSNAEICVDAKLIYVSIVVLFNIELFFY